jgi:hypothetical protein
MYFQYSLVAAKSAMWEEDGTSGFAHSSKREEVEMGEGGDERLVVLTALGCPAAPHPHGQDADRTPEQRGADFFTRKMEQLRQPRSFQDVGFYLHVHCFHCEHFHGVNPSFILCFYTFNQ